MKKIILSLLMFCLIFFVAGTTYAQDIFSMKDNVPGISCGVAGDTTGKDKCCAIQSDLQCNNPAVNFATGLLQYVPVVGGYVGNYAASCQKVQTFVSQAGNSACLQGNATIGNQPTTNYSDPSCKCVDPNATTTNVNTAVAEMCYKYLGSSSQKSELGNCLSCSSQNGMWTGLGCLPLDVNRLISSFVMTTGIGLGGMFALLCIIYSAFTMQTSQGNPEKLKKAQENITSCILGLILIIFSIFILKFVGVTILQIPFLK